METGENCYVNSFAYRAVKQPVETPCGKTCGECGKVCIPNLYSPSFLRRGRGERCCIPVCIMLFFLPREQIMSPIISLFFLP